MIEDSAGETLIGDEGGNAQAITAVGADENIDSMDAAEERGPIEACGAIGIGGRPWHEKATSSSLVQPRQTTRTKPRSRIPQSR